MGGGLKGVDGGGVGHILDQALDVQLTWKIKCMYVCMYTCIHVYMYTCMYVYVYTHLIYN